MSSEVNFQDLAATLPYWAAGEPLVKRALIYGSRARG